MAGKRGLIMGVANERSIAWGIARVLAGQGAEARVHLSGRRLRPPRHAARPVASAPKIIEPCDVLDLASVDNVFDRDQGRRGASSTSSCTRWPSRTRSELSGRYSDTTRENFTNTMVISCFSFTEIAKRAAELMPDGGSMLTLTYGGATRVVPSYNVMGVAKAALEASVRYLAADLGPTGHSRQRAVGRADAHALRRRRLGCPRDLQLSRRSIRRCKRTPTLDEVGGSALYLLSRCRAR